MDLPQYVTTAEVQRICTTLKIRDWTQLPDGKVLLEEARAVMDQLDLADIAIPAADFQQGLEVELEHGTRFPEANVTNNHPLLTGKIVLAHLKESTIYYKRLNVNELEGDLLKAVAAGKADKAASVYARLARAREELAQAEMAQLG